MTPSKHRTAAETAARAPNNRSVRRVAELLLERYGQRAPQPQDPLDGLVLIILSQATNDLNCDRAFRSLKSHFPTWNEVLAAPTSAVADAIRIGGLANQKAERIRGLLQEIKSESGALDLSWMHQAPAAECRAYLQRFHGVGPKTIACVLLFFLNKPAFPVDTHVHRVAKRLGWIRPQAAPEEAHRVLEAAVPDECKLDLHVNLISHGRAVCRADGNGGPLCGACVLRRHCAHWKSLSLAERQARMDRTLDGASRDVSDFFVTVGSS